MTDLACMECGEILECDRGMTHVLYKKCSEHTGDTE